MIDLYCPHCGFELTEAEIRRFTASLNGRRPKKRKVKTVPISEEIASRPTLQWLASRQSVCVHGRVRSTCLACERRSR